MRKCRIRFRDSFDLERRNCRFHAGSSASGSGTASRSPTVEILVRVDVGWIGMGDTNTGIFSSSSSIVSMECISPVLGKPPRVIGACAVRAFGMRFINAATP